MQCRETTVFCTIQMSFFKNTTGALESKIGLRLYRHKSKIRYPNVIKTFFSFHNLHVIHASKLPPNTAYLAEKPCQDGNTS